MSKYFLNGFALSAFIMLLVGCSSAPLPKVATEFRSRGQAKLVIDKDYRGAIADFTYAIEFNPHDSYSYLGRGMAYEKMGNIPSAHEDFKKAISLNPDLTQAVRPFLQ